jgi:hypothetical protein
VINRNDRKLANEKNLLRCSKFNIYRANFKSHEISGNFSKKQPEKINIKLNKLIKCSITYLNLPIQEKDGNMSTLFDVWNTIQTQLFPSLEQQLDPLTDKKREFIQVVSLLDLPGEHGI